MYSACQVRKMTVDNLGPTASAMNFGKYSAQNYVCLFDYSNSVRLKRRDGNRYGFSILILFALLLVSKATQSLLLCITTIAGK